MPPREYTATAFLFGNEVQLKVLILSACLTKRRTYVVLQQRNWPMLCLKYRLKLL